MSSWLLLLLLCRQMQPDFTAGDKHIASADDVTVVLRAIQLPTAQLLQPGTLTLVVSKIKYQFV